MGILQNASGTPQPTPRPPVYPGGPSEDVYIQFYLNELRRNPSYQHGGTPTSPVARQFEQAKLLLAAEEAERNNRGVKANKHLLSKDPFFVTGATRTSPAWKQYEEARASLGMPPLNQPAPAQDSAGAPRPGSWPGYPPPGPWEHEPSTKQVIDFAMQSGGPSSSPMSDSELALREGGIINRLLGQAVGARVNKSPQVNDSYARSPRAASPLMQAISGDAPTTFDGMGAADVVRSAEGAGEVPVDFYRDRMGGAANPGMVDTLAYDLPTPSNGESREQAAARMLRMRNGYVNGQPVPQGPEADLIRAQFWTRGGNRTPQTEADLAAINQRTQQYADMIRGHGGTQDFSLYAGQQSGLPIEDVQAFNRRTALMSPSDRSILALAAQRNAAPSPLAQAVGMGGETGPAGAAGPAGMTPEQAMARLMERRGGQYYPGQGYVPQTLMDEHVDPAIGGVIPEEKIVAGLARAGAGSEVSGISPAFRKELDAREAAVQARGKVRGAAQVGRIPPEWAQDWLFREFAMRSPEAAASLMGARQDHTMGLMQLALAQQEAERRAAMGEREFGLKERALGIAEKEAEAEAALAMPAVPGVAPAGAAPDPTGFMFNQEESAMLTGKTAEEIAEYAKQQGWSNTKGTRAIRQFVPENKYGTMERPGGWYNFFKSPWGQAPQPGQELTQEGLLPEGVLRFLLESARPVQR